MSVGARGSCSAPSGGGLLIGLPLLFTMEMWFHSFLLPSWKIVLLLAVAFVVVIGYTAVSGFRRDRSRAELVVDAVETMGIAAVVAPPRSSCSAGSTCRSASAMPSARSRSR
jgi:uncharacterized membrane protein